MHFICEAIHVIACECVSVYVQPEALSAEWLLRVNLAICLGIDWRLKPCSLN